MTTAMNITFSIYRVIQEESARLWEMIVCVNLRKIHINKCPIFDGYVDMTV
jgi:exonuclease I